MPRVHPSHMWRQNSLLSLQAVSPQIPYPSSLVLNLFAFPLLFLILQILMAETSALCFSTLSSLPSNIYRSGEANSSLSFASPFKFPASHPRSSRFIRFTCKASDSGNFLGDEPLGFFPWSDGDNGIHMSFVPHLAVLLS